MAAKQYKSSLGYPPTAFSRYAKGGNRTGLITSGMISIIMDGKDAAAPKGRGARVETGTGAPTVAQASDTSLLGKVLDAPEPRLTALERENYAARMARLHAAIEAHKRKAALQDCRPQDK